MRRWLAAASFYVLLNWDYYRLHLLDILWVWQGGLSGSGALLGGCLGLLLAAWYGRVAPAWLADQFLPLLASLMVTGWLACWLGGCAYGAVSNAWWALPSGDEWGVSDFRLPVQFSGAVISALGLGWLERNRAFSTGTGWLRRWHYLPRHSSCSDSPLCVLTRCRCWSGLRMESWGALAALAGAVIFGIICLSSSRMEQP